MTRFPTYLLLAAVTACSSGSTGTAAPTPAPTSAPSTAPSASPTADQADPAAQVTAVTGNRFSPTAVTVHVGDTVRVVSTDAVASHNFVGTGFSSGTLERGQSYTATFDKAGTFAFVCTFHAELGMEGTVTVLP